MSRAGNAIIADRQRKIYDRILEQGIEFYHSDLVVRPDHPHDQQCAGRAQRR